MVGQRAQRLWRRPWWSRWPPAAAPSRTFRRAEELAHAAAVGRGRRVLPPGAAGVARHARVQDRARAGDAVGGAGPRPAGADARGRRAGWTRRCASTARPASSTRRTARSPARAAELDRQLREQLEASRPRPPIEQMREQARRKASQEPTLNPTSRDPLNLRFTNTSLRDLLNFIGSATGINVTYDRDFQDRTVTVQLEGVTLEQALQQVMLSNQIFYKVLNERTIIVATDNTAKRAAVRGAGDQDLLRLARRRHRAGPAGQHRDPGAADGHPAAHRPQQDRQHHHRAGLGPGRADHRADHPHQRPAARRGGDRRADPRGEPRADQALRAEPHRLRHRRHLFARAVALRQHRGRTR